MKKSKFVLDIALVVSLTLLSLLAVAPDALVMPSSLQMAILAVACAAVAAFLVFLWRETPADEREASNQFTASRFAYSTGAGFLIIALIYQGLTHQPDPFIPLTLLIMIGTKLSLQHTLNRG
ncbi:hypothetical protein BH11PAT4_BH11PAT4_6450 [soil metagenome]